MSATHTGTVDFNSDFEIHQIEVELHKSIIWKHYLGCCFADIKLISKYNKIIRFLSSVTVIFGSYVWVSLKDKKGIRITNTFQKILLESWW